MHATTTEFGRMCKEKTEYPNYKHHCHRPDQSSVFPASPSGPLAPIVACLNPQAQTANMNSTFFPRVLAPTDRKYHGWKVSNTVWDVLATLIPYWNTPNFASHDSDVVVAIVAWALLRSIFTSTS
jgi:hypothetical protein